MISTKKASGSPKSIAINPLPLAIKNGGPKIYCFDDLGAETIVKHYGTGCNVMAEILLSWYDLFVSPGILTHATTNLNSTELEAKYGN